MIPLCPCMCALYQGIWFQVVSKTVPVFPNVRQTMWGTDRGAKPYLEHLFCWLFCWLSRCKGWLTRFSRFGVLLMTAQNYTHKWYCGKRLQPGIWWVEGRDKVWLCVDHCFGSADHMTLGAQEPCSPLCQTCDLLYMTIYVQTYRLPQQPPSFAEIIIFPKGCSSHCLVNLHKSNNVLVNCVIKWYDFKLKTFFRQLMCFFCLVSVPPTHTLELMSNAPSQTTL